MQHVCSMYMEHAHVHTHIRTVTFEVLLLEESLHELTAHVTESGTKEDVVLKPVGHINLESLLQILQYQ